MKILIAGTTGDSMPPPYGGVPKVSLLYAREWKKTGHDVALVFVYRPSNADDLNAGATYFFEYPCAPTKIKKILFLVRHAVRHPVLYAQLLLAYHRIYHKFSREAILYAAYGVYLDGVIRTFKPDVLLGEATLIKSFMAAQIAKRHGVPVVFDTYAEIHDQNMGVNKNLTTDEQRTYWTAFLQQARLVLTISNCCVGAQKYLPHDRVKVFYDTCDFSLFQQPTTQTKEDARAYLKLPQETFLVGAVGAFSPRKGHDHLIQAVALARERGVNAGAAICGGSGDETWLRELAAQRNVSEHIHFLKKISEADLVTLHRAIDLYVNLSYTPRSCGLDLALLEGMAAGNPIMVYNYGGLPEAIPDGDNGILVETNNIPSVADAIVNLAQQSAEERVAMGAKSRTIAAKSDIRETAKIKLEWLQEAANARAA